MAVSNQVPPLFGKQVVAMYGTGGVNFTGRVVAYMAEPMYWIELPDGTKRWWAESLTKEASTPRPFCGRPGCCGEEARNEEGTP